MFRSRLDNRDGSALVFMVVALLGVLSLGALAADMGLLRTAHGEAQRAADAAALAGASAFMDGDPLAASATARSRALEYAARNTLRGEGFSADEATVEVVPGQALVRVSLRKPAVSTWFARMFRVNSAPVSATAAARATEAKTARCVKPFAPPDLWYDADDDTNRNRVPDDDERWEFDERRGDAYSTGANGKPATGYGTTYRGEQRDRGRKIELTESSEPGFANLWAVPEFDGSVDVGGAAVRDDITECSGAAIQLGKEYTIQRGIKAGPVSQGVNDLVDRDPTARWDEAQGVVVGSRFASWRDSPRVIRIPFYDPTLSGCELKHGIKFTRFAWVFVEPVKKPNSPVVARFIDIVRIVQLVE